MVEHRSILKNNHYAQYSLIFQDRYMFNHIIQKVSAGAFE